MWTIPEKNHYRHYISILRIRQSRWARRNDSPPDVPACMARVTRARVTAAASTPASAAFAWLSEARQSPHFGRRQAAAAPRGAPHGTGAGRPYPMDPTPGQAQLDDFTTERTGERRIRLHQTEVGITQGGGSFDPPPCEARNGARPRVIRARRYGAGKPRIASAARQTQRPAVSGPRGPLLSAWIIRA